MCGIVGIIRADRAAAVDREELSRMQSAIGHRGPDDSGEFLAPGIALGSKRLSILDLSPRGHMPMASLDRRYWIVYNGEVYNFVELRRDLESRGEVFTSGTDTEVVLRLFARDGPAMLDRLNGMFAFAIWDDRERELFVVRDRLGVKPLYFASRGGDLYFASEAKALIAAGFSAELDEEKLSELFCFRFVAGPESFLRGVRRLLPGHSLRWRAGSFAERRWWNLAERARAVDPGIRQHAVEWYRSTFDQSVALRRISDVPIGVLLSGGLDSSSVAASLALQGSTDLASFTVSFDDPLYDESGLAREVAARYGFEFHSLAISPERVAELLHDVSYLNDEPLVHGNDVQLYSLARYAKPRVTVLLSGEGGDETLGGYVRYRPLRYPKAMRAASGLPAPTRPGRLSKLRRMARLGSPDRWVLFNACDVLPDELRALGLKERESDFAYRRLVLYEARSLYPTELDRQAMYSDQHTFLCSILDRNDRMTMGASIECRVPFLDYRLVEGLAALPSSLLLRPFRSKALLRRAVGDRLPSSIRAHKKWGFGVPWFRYLRDPGPLRDWVASLPKREPIRSGYLSRAGAEELLRRFFAGDRTTDSLVRQLLMLNAWYEAVVARRSLGAEPAAQA